MAPTSKTLGERNESPSSIGVNRGRLERVFMCLSSQNSMRPQVGVGWSCPYDSNIYGGLLWM
jgi:hypothetical protein